MANDNKTRPNEADVTAFLESVEHDGKRRDSYEILAIMQEITGEQPQMWGGSIIGFGTYHYKYESGREGDWFLTGFSPRKANFSLYIMQGFTQYPELMDKLGKYKTGKSCLYINKLADIDIEVLKVLIRSSARYVKEHQSTC